MSKFMFDFRIFECIMHFFDALCNFMHFLTSLGGKVRRIVMKHNLQPLKLKPGISKLIWYLSLFHHSGYESKKNRFVVKYDFFVF